MARQYKIDERHLHKNSNGDKFRCCTCGNWEKMNFLQWRHRHPICGLCLDDLVLSWSRSKNDKRK